MWLAIVGLAAARGAPAAEEASAPATPAEPDGETTAWGTRTPPGSPEDQALWRAGVEVTRQVTLVRLQANKMQWRLRQEMVGSRLEALAAKADAPEAGRARGLLERYGPIAARNYQALTRQWPVDPTRGCSYQVMHMERVMESADHKRKPLQLLTVREELRDCVERAQPAVDGMASSNRELEGLIAEVVALLPPLPAAQPPAPGTAGPRSP